MKTISWLIRKEAGLYCVPGNFYIDPISPTSHAIISHAHSDHACIGHDKVTATTETLDIMKLRYGDDCSNNFNSLDYGTSIEINGVKIELIPAGHILGSSQICMEYDQQRVIFSGDYKRSYDPTCALFQPKPCDVLITEATFGLPIFQHPAIEEELKKLLHSLNVFSTHCHLLGVYPLGKCQRLIKTLRLMGYKDTFYLHPSLEKYCIYYQQRGFELGELLTVENLKGLEGNVVFCPPSALQAKWTRGVEIRFAMASGWMQIRARAKQKKIDLPLVISDHADWNDLIRTVTEINPKEVWITHGQEDGLMHALKQLGYSCKPLHLLGYEDEGQ